MSSYCATAPGHPWHGRYHDCEYGFPVTTDSELFERLILEINQAGLSWLTMLKKRQDFRRAYDAFDIDTVAGYTDRDRKRLLSDAGIVRNRLKVYAAIANARALCQIRQEYGSFGAWLDHHHPLAQHNWVRLFRKTFRFTGGAIVGEFLMSTGYLPGAHQPSCPVQAQIIASNPPWLRHQTTEAHGCANKAAAPAPEPPPES